MDQEIAVFRSFYRKLFSLGSFKVNLTRFLTSYIIYVLFLLYISRLQPLICYHLNGLLLLPIVLILHDSLISQFDKRDQKILIARRTLSLNTISTCLLLVGVLCALPFMTNEDALLLSLSLIVSFTIFFRIVVLYSVLKRHVLAVASTIVTILVWYVLTSLPLLMKKRQLELNTLSLSIEPILVSIAASVMFLVVLGTTTKTDRQYNAFDCLRAYLDSWLLHDPSSLEELLNRDSAEVKVGLNALIFPETHGGPSILLFPNLHYGPFGNAGSSSYPSMAGKYFHQKGIKSISFHTPSTHELDAINNEELIDSLKLLLEPDQLYMFNMISDIHEVKYRDATAYFVKLNEALLLVLEYKEMEDIPIEVSLHLKKKAATLGYKKVLIVDAHNSLGEDTYVLPRKSLKELTKVGEIALKRALRVSLSPSRISLTKVNVPRITTDKGLGNDGIAILLWETSAKLNLLICLDSNNIMSTLKDEIVRFFLEKHNLKPLIVTTDTHETVGIALTSGKHRGYNVLGELPDDTTRIIECIDRAYRKALKSLRYSEGLVYEKEITMKVMGKNALGKLASLLAKSFSLTKRMLIVALMLMLLNYGVLYFVLA